MSAVISSDTTRLLTRADLADLLRVSQRTIDRIIASGFAGRPPLRPIIQSRSGQKGGIVRFHPDHVREWLTASPEPTERRGRGRPRKYRPGNP